MVRSRRKSAVHEPEYQYIIRRLREAREEAGLTQVEVASALERPLSFVSKCELGERRIDPVDFRKFAELYEKPLDYFYPSQVRRRLPKPTSRPE
jgi:transcriptional regulator with XRE-family HTH domain